VHASGERQLHVGDCDGIQRGPGGSHGTGKPGQQAAHKKMGSASHEPMQPRLGRSCEEQMGPRRAWVFGGFRVRVYKGSKDPMKPSTEDIRDIYRSTIDDLYDFVARRCGGDRGLAEDITQETWLRAVDAWRQGLPERPGAWLTRVAANLISNHQRHRKVERIDDAADPDAVPDERAAEDSGRRRHLLQRALDALPAAQRRLIDAFHFDRKKVAEIASSSGASRRAVEGRLRRARIRLRRQVDHELQKED
jgi:RNA polymerase sigma factor (sigma-70 family)